MAVLIKNTELHFYTYKQLVKYLLLRVQKDHHTCPFEEEEEEVDIGCFDSGGCGG